MDEVEQTVRQTIRRFRIEQGLTQAQLAERLGVHRDTVSRVETGKRALELGEFFEWADALGVSSEELFQAICQAVPKVYAA